ncbi:spinocerebellar ataxia type 10 protein domain-containing protein [Rhodocollybia butyracea]|uniref:Ataxin-10 homolog n=1 Tax=Rhodocollybia butyracea TaxID=206335 RepID=A0A9P5QA47_9AGAR|nr:spinocerebellar ataxia type 10 protein domain-containing protein [Rhodocollybia butyracea]
MTFWDGDSDSSDDGEESSIKEKEKQRLFSLARFTGELVKDVPANQIKAFKTFEPIVRRLLHYFTSMTFMDDEEATSAARILTQMLSNITTGNETLIESLWETYLNLQEDQVVLIRLLASQDTRTLLAVLTLISSCIHESRARIKMLTRTATGARICMALLDNMVKLYNADEATNAIGAKVFDAGYSIFVQIIEAGFISDLYAKLAIPEEIVTSHQTTLLKLLNSYLQSTPAATSGTRTSLMRIHSRLSLMMPKLFFSLSFHAQTVMRSNRDDGPSDFAPDIASSPLESNIPVEFVSLHKVCEALVLVTQCIVKLVLDAQNNHGSSNSGSTSSKNELDVVTFFHQVHVEGISLTECIVGLLRLLHRFLPRINFGKSSSGRAVEQGTPAQRSISALDTPGFNFLKRDLVRLLGILCYEDQAVQDRLRKCGGIEVVMNLCVVDERNPNLREDAIFALHSLLKDNAANQAVVEELKPMGQWDESEIHLVR